jgi:hypothetical protein
LQRFVRVWWHDIIVPLFPGTWRTFAEELYEYESW